MKIKEKSRYYTINPDKKEAEPDQVSENKQDTYTDGFYSSDEDSFSDIAMVSMSKQEETFNQTAVRDHTI